MYIFWAKGNKKLGSYDRWQILTLVVSRSHPVREGSSFVLPKALEGIVHISAHSLWIENYKLSFLAHSCHFTLYISRRSRTSPPEMGVSMP